MLHQARLHVRRRDAGLEGADLRHLHAGIAAGIDAQEGRQIHRDVERQTVKRAAFADAQA